MGDSPKPRSFYVFGPEDTKEEDLVEKLLGSVEVFTVEPNDLLFIKGLVHYREMESLAGLLRGRLPDSVTLIFGSEGTTMEHMSEEEMELQGWVRKTTDV
jgi:hypothetical protein